MRTLKISVICGGLLLLLAMTTLSATIRIPTDQPTIQAGVDAGAPGDTILISAGIYYENIVVDKRLSLIGQFGYGLPIIDGSNNGNVLLINANGVTVKYLNFRGGGSVQEMDGPWDAGIHILRADSCVIIGCQLAYNGAAGLSLAHSSHCIIRRCWILENVNGVYFYEASQDYPIENDSGNIIDSNIIFYQTLGIRFAHTLLTHHTANIIRCNYFTYNTTGLSMIMSEKNEVYYNQFVQNTEYAIGLGMCMGGGDSNQFYLNYFVDNGTDHPQCGDGGGGPDFWYSEDYEMGNYWSDYTGVDLDQNGIGDTPYTLDGYDGVQDPFPMMELLDSDEDGWVDFVDNCMFTANPTQRDMDLDGIGDACCCSGHTGDVDCDHDRNLADITLLIDHVYITHRYLCCPASGNTSGDPDGKVNLADITDLIDLIYLTHKEVAPCP
jgi:parallel beta-helix repeat protein